jgi:hypothetical protein
MRMTIKICGLIDFRLWPRNLKPRHEVDRQGE